MDPLATSNQLGMAGTNLQHILSSTLTQTFNFNTTGTVFERIDPHCMKMITSYVIMCLTMCIVTNIGLLFNSIKRKSDSCVNTFSFNFVKFMYFVGYIIKTKIFRMKKVKQIPKKVTISYITSDKKINELYKAVSWYLCTAQEIDYIKESPLEFYYEEKLTTELFKKMGGLLKVAKKITKNVTKEIHYSGYKIEFDTNDTIINVYGGEQERKRENYVITLRTVIDEFTTVDPLDQFCSHCMKEYIKSQTSTVWIQKIYTHKGNEWTASDSHNRRSINTIVLQNDLKQKIVDDAEMFVKSKEWYNFRDIPWKRGYIFYGKPGTGKTSMIKAISLMFKKHIHYLMINEIESDTQLMELMKKINFEETILVIEDIDCMSDIVKSREARMSDEPKKEEKEAENSNKVVIEIGGMMNGGNGMMNGMMGGENTKTNNGRLTLSGLLNALDGVFETEGRMMIATSNRPEVMDKAVLRAGRFDRKFKFDNCNREQIRQLFEMFFEQPCDVQKLNMLKDENYSPAHITSVFLRFRDNPDDALMHLDEDEMVFEKI